MPKERTSKHEKRLRALGAQRWSEIYDDDENAAFEDFERLVGLNKGLSKAQRELQLRQRLVPNYVALGDALYATDDAFNDWHVPLEAESALRRLGFRNLGDRLATATAKFRRKMN